MSENRKQPDTATLDDRLRELPREVQPAHDLWPGIERRLEPRTGAVPPRAAIGARMWLAAAALLAAGIGIGLLLRSGAPVGAGADGVRSVSGAVATDVVPATAIGVDGSPTSGAAVVYRRAAADLRAGLDRRLTELDPVTRAVVARELARIDRAIDEIEQALATASERATTEGGATDDAVLEGFLLARYRQQIDLLNRFSPAAG